MSGTRNGRKRGAGRRYQLGTVSIAKGSTVVRGTGTNWCALTERGLPSLAAGSRIIIEGIDEEYEIHLVNSDRLMTLKRPFDGDSLEGARYVYLEPGSRLQASNAVRVAEERVVDDQDGDRLEHERMDTEATRETPSEHDLGEIVRTILYAFLIAFVIRAFLFQPFNIPSGSMRPTLLVGDYVFVSKFAYGYSRASLPYNPPLFSGRVFGRVPERGDVVVFKLPSDNKTDYIKRLVGLPGDHIQVVEGVLYINDKPITRERIEDFVERDKGGVHRSPRYRETLPNGVSYVTLDTNRFGRYDNTDVFVVPEGHFFAMGDNRDNSSDSRAAPDFRNPRNGGVGYVPFENLVGRAEIIFFATDGSARWWQFWRWPQATRYGRIFDRVE